MNGYSFRVVRIAGEIIPENYTKKVGVLFTTVLVGFFVLADIHVP